MDLVNYISASANVGTEACLLWARSGLAAAQRIMFEPRPESSRSLNAETSLFSNGWLGDRTFGDRKRPSGYEALNDDTEPEADPVRTSVLAHSLRILTVLPPIHLRALVVW